MSLVSNLQTAFTRVGTEFKALRTLIGGSGTSNISALTTTDKSSLVAAINEVKAGSSGAPPDASETTKGLVELATQAETNTGTDDARAITPLKFQTRLAAYAQPLDSDLTTLAGAGNSGVLAATTASFLTAHATKLGHVTVTQAVDLDSIETRVNALDAAVVLKGTWDASGGTFPGGGTAQAGDSYIVSVGGTVNGQAFVANDRIVAVADNASTTVYASNWHKLDYTDAVTAVIGLTGSITQGDLKTALGLVKADVGLSNVDNTSDLNKPVSNATQTALNLKADAANVYSQAQIGDPDTDFAAGFVAALS